MLTTIDHTRIGEVIDLVSDPLDILVDGEMFTSATGGLHFVNPLGENATRACILTHDQAPRAFYNGADIRALRKECTAAATCALATNSQPGLVSACDACDLKEGLDGHCPSVAIQMILANYGEDKADQAFAEYIDVNIRSRKKGKFESLGCRVISSVALRATDIRGFRSINTEPVDLEAKEDLMRHGSKWLTKWKGFIKGKKTKANPEPTLF